MTSLNFATGLAPLIYGSGLVLLVQAARLLLRHSIAVWAFRAASGEDADYEFTLQNLEGVPIASGLILTIEEEGVPENTAGLFDKQDDPAASRPALRIYSGCVEPSFRQSQVDGTPRTRVSIVTFTTMSGYDTWSLRLKSPAKLVTLKLATLNTHQSENRFPYRSFGLDLSVRSVQLNREHRAVTAGPRMFPTSSTAWTVAFLGPVLYAILLLVCIKLGWFPNPPEELGITDLVLALALAGLGIGWYASVRRHVLPAIQAYRSYWSPNYDGQRVD